MLYHHFDKIKKTAFLFSLPLILLCLLLCLCGCESKKPNAEISQSGSSSEQKKETLTVLCVDYPEYDWTKNLVGTADTADAETAEEKKPRIHVELLNESGADLHSYQPTIKDMVRIANCDLLIYTGGASQFWVTDALASYPNPSRRVLCLTDFFESEPNRFSTYIQDEDAHAHEHEHAHEQLQDAQAHAEEIDEHLWLSLKISAEFCREIAASLCALDSDASAVYQMHAAHYIRKLSKLDKQFENLFAQTNVPLLLFADRFPFLYFVQDYHLPYEAAFTGCSAETEASFETIVSLADTLRNRNLNSILVLDGGDTALAQTVIRTADRKDVEIRTLYSMQSLPQAIHALKETGKIDRADEVSYLFLMQENYRTLAQIMKGTVT